jgi:hypothetical protein
MIAAVVQRGHPLLLKWQLAMKLWQKGVAHDEYFAFVCGIG